MTLFLIDEQHRGISLT